MKVLRRLHCITAPAKASGQKSTHAASGESAEGGWAGGVVTLKGRAVAEISTSDELVVTELLFSGSFVDLSPPLILALLSCFVWDERVSNPPALSQDLKDAFELLHSSAVDVAVVFAECLVQFDGSAGGRRLRGNAATGTTSFSRGRAGATSPEQIARQFADTFKSTLMPCVIRWCAGAPFSEICGMLGNTFEGSIIRSMRRLSELAVQVLAAAKVMGNSGLVEKLEEGIKIMHRDIVFAASLYL